MASSSSPPTKTIRKALISSFSTDPSDVSNLSVVSAPAPQPPTKNEIQVRVLYAGFSGADINMARGTYPLQRKAPFTPGYSLVGTVIAVGDDNHRHRFQPGDFVTAVTTYDAQAELVNVPRQLAIPVPSELCTHASDALLRQVTAMALDWNTAYGMVSRAANVQAGHVVFIHGLSGAVGQALLSLCLMRGAHVYGTASSRNHAALLSAGVKGVFEYTSKEWISTMQATSGGVDAVFDALGFESWDESYSILSSERGGVLVGYGGNQGALDGEKKQRKPWLYIVKLLVRGAVGEISKFLTGRGKTTRFYYIRPGTERCESDMVSLMELLKEGTIEVPIKGCWNLDTEGLREAHQSWGKMDGMGSLLIKVTGEKKL
ncbi:chaperonin 10-like protein [Apodospora peruviana]|uniref:Chaperonin 10-like protein n=1 Tax=Apodospora peruviana TaxID=516989 RepID=A0AAE0IKY2_9PEZI|nr:chaperonin 10-like protein [Apodospora peruviana]